MAGQPIKNTHWPEPHPEAGPIPPDAETSANRDVIEACKQKYEALYRQYVRLFDSEHVQLSTGLALQQSCLEIACSADTVKALLDAYVQLLKIHLKCHAVGIRIRDEAGNIPYQAYDGFSRAFYESENRLSLHSDQCMCIAVIKGAPTLIRDYFTPKGSYYINSTSQLLATASARDLGNTRNVCHAHGYQSVALIPIVVDRTIEGLIHVADCRENRFPLRVVETLEDVSLRMGLSLRRFHLQEKLRESVDALNALSSHLLTVQENEQWRIAMELHDGCGQDLNVLKLRLKGIQERLPTDAINLIEACGHLLTYTDKIINDIRNIAHGLKPAALDALGLTVAARQMMREFATSAKIDVKTDIDSLDRITAPLAQICMFRIFQEALTNVHKHAQATRVSVTAAGEGKDLWIRIQDNGIGFNAHNQSDGDDGHRGMGLSALAQRCRMIGARLSIDSEAGKGTRLSICLPCPQPKAGL